MSGKRRVPAPASYDFTAMDYAWAAGLMDGDGCITLARQAWNRRKDGGQTVVFVPTLIVNVTGKPICDRMAELFGGISRPTQHRQSWAGRRQMWRWRVSGGHAIEALLKFSRYLVLKREVAQLLIRFYGSDRPLPLEEKEALCQSVRNLNWRGWPAPAAVNEEEVA